MQRTGHTRLVKLAQCSWLGSTHLAHSAGGWHAAASTATFASAAGPATKEGSEAKKEAKKSALQSFFGAIKVPTFCRLIFA